MCDVTVVTFKQTTESRVMAFITNQANLIVMIIVRSEAARCLSGTCNRDVFFTENIHQKITVRCTVIPQRPMSEWEPRFVVTPPNRSSYSDVMCSRCSTLFSKKNQHYRHDDGHEWHTGSGQSRLNCGCIMQNALWVYIAIGRVMRKALWVRHTCWCFRKLQQRHSRRWAKDWNIVSAAYVHMRDCLQLLRHFRDVTQPRHGNYAVSAD